MESYIQEVLFSHEEIVNKCEELGKRISADYEGKKPLLVGLLRGSIPFMSELMMHISCPLEIDFMDVSSYHGVKSTGHVVIKKDLDTPVKNRHVIIVEDIIDTGLTLQDVVNLFKDRGCASIEIATLLDKPEGRKFNCQEPKYIGFNCPNKFVVGYGLDYDQLYRNLGYIGVLKPEVYQNNK